MSTHTKYIILSIIGSVALVWLTLKFGDEIDGMKSEPEIKRLKQEINDCQFALDIRNEVRPETVFLLPPVDK